MSEDKDFRSWSKRLNRAAKRYNDAEWAIADLMAEGQTKFGPRANKHIKFVTLIPSQTIKRFVDTAIRFPTTLRNSAWKVITHTRLLSITDPNERDDLYQKAIDQRWTDQDVNGRIVKRGLVKNRAKVQKGVDHLESVLKFGRKLLRIEDNWDRLPRAQQQLIAQEGERIQKKLNQLKA